MIFNFDYKPTKEDHGKWFFVRMIFPFDKFLGKSEVRTHLRQVRYSADTEELYLCPESHLGMEGMSYGNPLSVYSHVKLGFSEPIATSIEIEHE